MVRLISTRVLLWAIVTSLAVVLVAAGRPAVGQQEESGAKPAAAKEKTQKPKKSRGRLPAYYGKVVDKKQRQAIYEIQKEYRPKIAALKAQLAAITKERNEKIAAVLTPEQQERIEALKAAAKARRLKKAAAKKAAKAPDAE